MSDLRDKARVVLYDHAIKNNDGFMTGQVRWILDAMIYFAENKDSLPPPAPHPLQKEIIEG